MFEYTDEFSHKIREWVKLNNTHKYYLYATQQSDKTILPFCKCIFDLGKIPIIITNVGKFDGIYSYYIKLALTLSDDVRVYEVAKMGMTVVLQSKAKLFIKTNGGILWIP